MRGQGFKVRDHESPLSSGEGGFMPSMACSRTRLCWERMPFLCILKHSCDLGVIPVLIHDTTEVQIIYMTAWDLTPL